MSLLFNMLSRLVIAFLPRSKCLLISRLQSSFGVILDPGKIESVSGYIVSPSICSEVIRPDAMIYIFWMLSFKPSFHSLISLGIYQSFQWIFTVQSISSSVLSFFYGPTVTSVHDYRKNYVHCLVVQLCSTLCNPQSWTVAHQASLSMGILQARILEWVAVAFSRGSS